MPSLASMRSIDQTETFQPLGPAVKPAPVTAPVPASKPTGTPGVVQLPDGKLATELPLPPQKPAVRVHDSVCWNKYLSDIEDTLCSTCRGTGQVYQEHQRGCHVGGTYNCPDCDGVGELP